MTAPGDHRPVWLLDVDGVLNAVTRSPDASVWPRWRTGTATARSRAWPITWSPDVVGAVVQMHRSGTVDIRWLTTWMEAAVESLAPLLGLPELPVVPLPEPSERGRPHGFLGTRSGAGDAWWKLAAARAVLDPQPGRALVWTDDDLAWEPDARGWAQRRAAPTLLVAPATATGLTPDQLATIERFCRGRS